MTMRKDQIEHNFTYHAPRNVLEVEHYGVLRNAAKTLANLYADLVPESRELSLALTKLEESVMWANAGIARNPKPENLAEVASPPPAPKP